LHHADNRDWSRLCVDFREHKRQDQFVPGENKCEDGDDRQRGAQYREVDSQQQLKMAAAVNERCIIKLPRQVTKKSDQHPDREGKREGQIYANKPREGVEKTQPIENEIERNHDCHGRHHPKRENPEQDLVTRSELKSGQG
jgi:hypothetical protein